MKVKLPKKIQDFLWSNGSIVQDGDNEYCFLPLYFVKSPNGIEMFHLEHMPNYLSDKIISLRDYQTDKPNPDNYETTRQGVIKNGKVCDFKFEVYDIEGESIMSKLKSDDIFEIDDYVLLPSDKDLDMKFEIHDSLKSKINKA